MIGFELDQASVKQTTDHLEQTRKNILIAMRRGMREGMELLANTVADKLQGGPIVSRSGRLLGHVLGSVKVTETKSYIKGTVDANLGALHIGSYLEGGTNVPSTLQQPKGVLYHFTAADGNSVFTHGHGAFQVAPKPFLNPSLIETKGTIMELIQSRIAEAVDGAV